MRTIFIIVALLVVMVPFTTDAQDRWKRNRKELTFGVGASNFLGDLGGADRIGTNGFRDLDIEVTRPVGTVGYRYQTTLRSFVKGAVTLGYLRGDDNSTGELARNRRALSFMSPIAEFAVQYEYYFLMKSRNSHIYRLRGVRGQKGFNLSAYAFIGFGGLFFNPMGKIDENYINPEGGPDGQEIIDLAGGKKWHSLRPLRTEGQGAGGEHIIFPNDPENYEEAPDGHIYQEYPAKIYSRFTPIIPMGIGVKRAIDQKWSIIFEVGLRKTFTDYIDDVSTFYAEDQTVSELAIANGQDPVIATYFADPSLPYADETTGEPVDPIMHNPGTVRGSQRGDDSDNDSYMFMTFSLNYKLAKKRRNLPKF